MEASAKPKDLKGGKSVYDEHRRERLIIGQKPEAKTKENEKKR